MYDYVIVHASFGHPFEHWYAWLFNELTRKGKQVLVPQFPCGEDIQNYSNWSAVMDSYRPFLNENTTYVGHSIGPAFISSYISNNRLKAKNLFFVAPVLGEINAPDYNAVNKTFFQSEKWRIIPELTDKRICYISKTDPYVPNELSENFANIINAQKVYVDNAGHFNTYAGYLQFEMLLKDIEANE